MNDRLELYLWLLMIPLSTLLCKLMFGIMKSFMFYRPRRRQNYSEISKCVVESEDAEK